MQLAGALTAVLWALAVAQEEQREVPIIKQINRVNDDGTYTFGYEAADGSFKIETRDVLGNVKGMFGYVDDRGELKRVSYTASNGTGFQASGSGGRTNRRPVLVYRGLSPQRVEQESSTTGGYGEYASTTEEPRPLRILVTKRPRNPNLIRRQLDRDPARTQPDPREVYRNQLLEQNNLKPEYTLPRARYYAPQVQEEYNEAPAERTLPQRYTPQPPRYRQPYDDPYGLPPQRRYPQPLGGFRRPPYDSYDYETFREAMNYLIQYLQYMRRADPYGPYPDDYPRPRFLPPGYPSGRTPYPAAGLPYQPPNLPYQPPNLPYQPPNLPYQPPNLPYQPPNLPYPPPNLPFQPPNLPYVNPNVQYSSSETSQASATEQLSSLKSRMDGSDQSDSADTRPPSSSLIRMLLARPSTQRPAIRSVEILGTASTTTTTQQPDLMEASS